MKDDDSFNLPLKILNAGLLHFLDYLVLILIIVTFQGTVECLKLTMGNLFVIFSHI